MVADKRGVKSSPSFESRSKQSDNSKVDRVTEDSVRIPETTKLTKSTSRRLLGGSNWHRSSVVQGEDEKEVRPAGGRHRTDMRESEFGGTFLAPVLETETAAGRVYHLTQQDFCPVRAPPPVVVAAEEDSSSLCESETVVVSLSVSQDEASRMTKENNSRNVELREVAELEMLAPRRPIALVQPQQKMSALLSDADINEIGSFGNKRSTDIIIATETIDLKRNISYDHKGSPSPDILEKICLSPVGSWEPKRHQSIGTPDDVNSKKLRSKSLEALLSPNPSRTATTTQQTVRFVYYDDAEDSMPVDGGGDITAKNRTDKTTVYTAEDWGNSGVGEKTSQNLTVSSQQAMIPRRSSNVEQHNLLAAVQLSKPVRKSLSNHEHPHGKVINDTASQVVRSTGDLSAISKMQSGSDHGGVRDLNFSSPASGAHYAARHSEYNWQFKCPPPRITSNFATLRADEILAAETETLKMRNQAKADKKDAEIATELENLNINTADTSDTSDSVQDIMCSQRSLYSEQSLGYLP